MAKKSLAEREAKRWIKKKRKEYDTEGFQWIAAAIINGSKITDKLPMGAKEIIKEKLAKEFGWELPEAMFYRDSRIKENEVLPTIKRPSLEKVSR